MAARSRSLGSAIPRSRSLDVADGPASSARSAGANRRKPRPNRDPPHIRRAKTRRRLWHVWIRWRVILLLAVVLTLFVLGVIGFERYARPSGVRLRQLDAAYKAAGLFVLQTGAVDPPIPWQLELSRFLAPATTILATIGVVLTIVGSHLTRLRIRRWKGHVVVCGLGRTGLHLARGFREHGQHGQHRVVVIERDPTNGDIEDCEEVGILLLRASADSRSVLRAAGAMRASYVFAVTDDRGVNEKVAVKLDEDLRRSKERAKVTCFVRSDSADYTDYLEEIREANPRRRVRVVPFDTARMGATAMLAQGGWSAGSPAHVLVVGAGDMGRYVVATAIQCQARSPRGFEGFRITIVDTKAHEHRRLIHDYTPAFPKHILEAIEMDVRSSEFDRGRFVNDPNAGPVTAVYIALGDDALGIIAARALRKHTQVPIVVRTRSFHGLSMWAGDSAENGDGIVRFPLLRMISNPKEVKACASAVASAEDR